jgi:two-component system, sensor histidine kinase and response regulator
MIAPLPSTEEERLKALVGYQILDTLPEQAFDDITLLAAEVCETETAAISLVDRDRQWFKSKVGETLSETSRDASFCAHGILQTGVFIVQDAVIDPRFADNPMVIMDPKIRFYAGAPLITPDGHAMGMLSVSGPVARTLDQRQSAGLEALGRQVVAQMELRRSNAELARSVKDLALARDAALAAVDARSHFLATMSHEIRTPMNGVIGLSDLLLQSSLNEKQRGYVEGISESGELLLSIINDILDFSKIDAGKLSFENVNFDLGDVLDGAVNALLEKAQAKGIYLLGLIRPNVFTELRGDGGRVRQVLTNLVGNALKFTKQGDITVRVSQKMQTSTEVLLHFEVKDTGIGISTTAQQYLFEPFNQAESSTTRNYGGSGLGLAICRQLVGMMRGEIGVESELGKGSTFWFTAYFTKQPEARGLEENRESLIGLHALAVTGAGSDHVLGAHLSNFGMRVKRVSNCAKALEWIRAEAEKGDPFKLIVLDLERPEEDGVKLVRAVKEDASLGKIGVLILAFAGQRLDVALFRGLGIKEFVIKPLKQKAFFAGLVNSIGKGSPPRAVLKPRITVQGADPGAAERLRSSAKARILLCEDNVMNQFVAVGMLEQLGYVADVVNNGALALEAVRKTAYDIIFMDCEMPQLDGYHVTRSIREQEETSGGLSAGRRPVHIIALTAGAMSGIREKCLSVGMNDYLSKPVSGIEFRAALERWETGERVRLACLVEPAEV